MGLVLRLLLIAAVVWLGIHLLRKWRRGPDDQTSSPPPSSSKGKAGGYQPMVRCRECGMHLPAQAVSSQGLCGKCLR